MISNPQSRLGEVSEQLNTGKKIVALSLIPIPMLLIMGLLGYQKEWIVSTEPEEKESTLSLQPPSANLKEFDHKNKYASNPSGLNISGTLLNETTIKNTQKLTGKNPQDDGWGENTSVELANVEKQVSSSNPSYHHSPEVQRRELLGMYQQSQNRTIARQNSEIQALYKNAASNQEIEDPTSKAANEELVKTLRFNNKLLEQQVSGKAPTSIDLESWRSGLKERIQQYDASGTDSIFHPTSFKEKNPESKLKLSSERVNIQTNHARNGFYSLGGKKIDTGISNPNTDAQTIPAVIHGEGDGITVENGMSVWIRLTQETQLTVGKNTLKLPVHTLISGNCSVSGDRLKIIVTNIRVENNLFPIHLIAFDLDGKEGLYVPSLQEKTKIAQSLSQSASGSVSPYMFLPQGNVGQQVGAQVAIQATNAGFNVARGLIQQKMSQPKVTIKSNHRILLRVRN